MKYKLLFSASKVGGPVAANYDEFFDKAQSLGATWDGEFMYIPDEGKNRVAIFNAAHIARINLIPYESIQPGEID